MKKISILVVEDDKWLAEQYLRSLTLADYDVAIANHALSAIQLIDKVKPSVIILDVVLTGSTAFGLLHELQSYGDTGLIPIIICTSIAGELSFEKLKLYGVQEIIDKTKMLPEDLVLAVKRVL